MYQSRTSLKPPLNPSDYCSEEQWRLERRAVFSNSWHLVTTASILRESGSYVSLELLGVPIVVRNFNGELVALRNVCAHRQSLLVTKPCGHSPTLKCPYHGWEYGKDGRTRKLPGAANFPHFEHNYYCLDRFQLDRCGDLVFVRLSAEGPSLSEWMGERFDKFAEWFSAPYGMQTMQRRFEYPANWKIPVEGSLESYHIPSVHPATFNEDPGESRSNHIFCDTGSTFETTFLTPRWRDRRLKDAERFMMWIFGVPFTGHYEHHQIFPNLMISHTDSLSLAQVVHPIGPSSAFGLVFQYGRRPVRGGIIPDLYAWGWGKFSAWLTRQVLNEDLHIYPLVQRGAAAASRPGLLGRCEERLSAFQKYIRDRIEAYCEPDSTNTDGVFSDEPTTIPESVSRHDD